MGSSIPETSPVIGGLLMIHKIIMRGLIISIRKCDEYLLMKTIPHGEAEGFSMYVSTLKWVTHAHHLSEEEIVFPYFKEYIEAPYERLKDDHLKISSVMVSLEQCLPEISSGRVGRLREVLNDFENLWGPHIRIEEENFTTKRLPAALGIKEQISLSEKLARHGSKNSGPGPLALPFLFYNLDGKDREVFMRPFPWIVKKVFVPIIWKEQWKPMNKFLL
jgi:hemerythrin-like domain-containing protein